jgi:hypothetical protein
MRIMDQEDQNKVLAQVDLVKNDAASLEQRILARVFQRRTSFTEAKREVRPRVEVSPRAAPFRD